MAGIPGDGYPVKILRPWRRGRPATGAEKAAGWAALAAAAAVAIAAAAAGGAPDPGPAGGAPAGPPADAVRGTVTRIIDGDTLEIDGTRIRLALVDAPDADRSGRWAAYGTAARACPVGSEAAYDPDDGQPGGSHGRVLAEVWCAGASLNQALRDAGQARVVTQFCGVSEFAGRPWAAGECGPR